jgi:hypothetical protein
MKNFTIDELENQGFKYTGTSYPTPSLTSKMKLAKELDVTLESLSIFRISDYDWAAFLVAEPTKGYIEQPILF